MKTIVKALSVLALFAGFVFCASSVFARECTDHEWSIGCQSFYNQDCQCPPTQCPPGTCNCKQGEFCYHDVPARLGGYFENCKCMPGGGFGPEIKVICIDGSSARSLSECPKCSLSGYSATCNARSLPDGSKQYPHTSTCKCHGGTKQGDCAYDAQPFTYTHEGVKYNCTMPAKSTGCYFFMYGGAIDSDLIGAAVGGSVSTGSIGGVSAGGGSGGGASSFNPEAYNCKAAQCSSGQTEYEFCENCGTRERSCTSSGAWGAWGSCNNLS